MKKILFLFLISSLYLSSQTVQKVEVIKSDDQINKLFNEIGNNELKVDLLDLIASTSIDVTYEKIKETIDLSVQNTSSNWADLFSLTPCYRFYFFNKRDYGGAGFFAEIFSKFSSMRYDVEYYNYNSNPDQPGIDYWTFDEEKEFTIALGASIGQKWVNKKGWTFEINFGVGRYLTNNKVESMPGRSVTSLRPTAAIKGGFGIGKRF